MVKKLDELGESVFKSKYALPGENTHLDMHKRLAQEFSQHTTKYTYEEILEKFKNFKYIIPQGSVMSMVGNNTQIGSASNCFVIGQPQDSYGGIILKDQQLVQLMKRRGGVGIDISSLRPADTVVANAAKTSTGAASFMERYSNSTREVAQSGRRGALMISMDVRHPDILQFVEAKQDLTKVTGANISVFLRDDFMRAAQEDQDYILRWPCDSTLLPSDTLLITNQPYDKVVELYGNPYKIAMRIRAKELWDKIVHCAWNTAEPGLMFLDRHWNYSPDGVYSKYKGVTTNPCSEIFMQEYDACRLICVNLTSVIDNPYEKQSTLNRQRLYDLFYMQTCLGDALVDIEIEKIDKILGKIKSDPEDPFTKEVEKNLWENIREATSSGRRIGGGFTGLGDTLAMMGFTYGSEDSKRFIKTLMKEKLRAELDATMDLASQLRPFVGWDKHAEFELSDGTLKGKNAFFQMLVEEFPERALRMFNMGRRNVSWSTVAPTGTVSLLTETTSGMEPLFEPYYTRRKKVNPGDGVSRVDFVDQNGDSWQEYTVIHPQFQEWLKLVGDGEASKEQLEKAFKRSPWYGSTANDINWTSRVEIQGIIQQYTTHSISSTINLPSDVSKDKVSEIYLTSWEKGLKGVTVYRDGSRSGVLVKDTITKSDALKRPVSIPCDIHKILCQGDTYFVLVGLVKDYPYEVFVVDSTTANLTKFHNSRQILTKQSRGFYVLELEDGTTIKNITKNADASQDLTTRLVSGFLRHSRETSFVMEQLNKSKADMSSFGKAIARILKKYVKDGQKVSGTSCNSCGSDSVIYEEGCHKCMNCGSSACG